MSLQIASNNMPATIAAIEKKWKTLLPDVAFNYDFVDDAFSRLYSREERFGQLFLYFAIVAIIIACIGLITLAVYSTLQRVKEIGVRKVLGATITDITMLVSKDFIRLVLIAIFIASPISWWAMHNWLQSFAYRVNISGWIFILAALLTLSVSLIIVSILAVKAAVTNPVKSLRSE
jgi:putative ABC transport system permease protein